MQLTVEGGKAGENYAPFYNVSIWKQIPAPESRPENDQSEFCNLSSTNSMTFFIVKQPWHISHICNARIYLYIQNRFWELIVKAESRFHLSFYHDLKAKQNRKGPTLPCTQSHISFCPKMTFLALWLSCKLSFLQPSKVEQFPKI